MLADALDDLWPYALCALPGALVAWTWIEFRRRGMAGVDPWRRRLAWASLTFGTGSSLVLVLFPGVLQYLESSGSEPGDGFYLTSLQVGLVTAVGAVATSPFAIGRPRLLLVASGILLIGIWFVVGIAY